MFLHVKSTQGRFCAVRIDNIVTVEQSENGALIMLRKKGRVLHIDTPFDEVMAVLNDYEQRRFLREMTR